MNNLMNLLPPWNPKYLALTAFSLTLSAHLSMQIWLPAEAQTRRQPATRAVASASAIPQNTTPSRSSAIPAPIYNPAPQSSPSYQSNQPSSGSLLNPLPDLSKDLSRNLSKDPSKDISPVDKNSDMPALRPMQLPDGQPMAPDSPIVSGTVQFSEQPQGMGSGMTILQSLDEALVKSPRAAAIRSQLQITTANYAEAAAGPNPGFLFDRAPLGEQVRRIGPTFTIEGPWKLVFRLLATKRLVEQTKTDLMTAIWALRADVRRAYTEVVVAQETVETLNSLYDLASRLLEVSDKRFQAGDVPELDVLKARLATSQADVERQVGMRRVIRAKQQLNVIMGRKPEDIVNIPRLPAFLGIGSTKLDKSQKAQLLPDFSVEPAPLASYLQKAMDQRLELKSVEQRIKLNKAQMRTAIANVVPNPSVTFGNSVSGNAPTGPKVSSVFFAVMAESPITNWNQGEIYRLKATANQLKYEMGAQKNIITAQVSSAYNNVLAARQKLKVYQEHILSDSYEVARLARRSYEVGQSDITATLLVQQANVAVRSQYLDAVRAYQEAYTDLEQSCGRPLEIRL
ncbi:MAG: TolC family protein [Candidatus Melainabacteria bacterium]|nr:TolC family protein [Candidatus Melainabacteria bacterium]